MTSKLPRPEGFDIVLNFFVNILKFKSLHWGYWKNIKKHSFSNLGKAQEAYTLKLLKFVPPNVKNVLDVGAGIGDNAIKFSEQGYRVLAISPEPTQKKAFDEITKRHKNISFIQSKYEDLNIKTKFDLILMSESSNYFPLEKGLQQSVAFLKESGRLLVAGLFRKKSTKIFSAWNIYSEFEDCAEKVGLTLIKKEDITEEVVPNIQIAQTLYEEYARPSLDLLTNYYKKAFKWRVYFISLLFKKEIQLIKALIYEDLENRLNSRLFKKHASYLIYLFQKK